MGSGREIGMWKVFFVCVCLFQHLHRSSITETWPNIFALFREGNILNAPGLARCFPEYSVFRLKLKTAALLKLPHVLQGSKQQGGGKISEGRTITWGAGGDLESLTLEVCAPLWHHKTLIFRKQEQAKDKNNTAGDQHQKFQFTWKWIMQDAALFKGLLVIHSRIGYRKACSFDIWECCCRRPRTRWSFYQCARPWRYLRLPASIMHSFLQSVSAGASDRPQ